MVSDSFLLVLLVLLVLWDLSGLWAAPSLPSCDMIEYRGISPQKSLTQNFFIIPFCYCCCLDIVVGLEEVLDCLFVLKLRVFFFPPFSLPFFHHSLASLSDAQGLWVFRVIWGVISAMLSSTYALWLQAGVISDMACPPPGLCSTILMVISG